MLRLRLNHSIINPAFFFFVTCIFGILSGAVVSRFSFDTSLLIYIAIFGYVSIASFLPLIFFPFLMVLFLKKTTNLLWIYFFGFIKSFGLGLLGQAIFNTFHCYTLFFYLLLLLCDLYPLFFLILFSLIKLNNKQVSYKDIFKSFFICSLVWLFSLIFCNSIVI